MNYISTHSTYFEGSGGNSYALPIDARTYFTFYYSQNELGQTTYTMQVYAQWVNGTGEGLITNAPYDITVYIAGETFRRTGVWSSGYFSNTPQLTHLFTITKTVNCNTDGTGIYITYGISSGKVLSTYKGGNAYGFTPPTVVLVSSITNNTSSTSRLDFGKEITFTIDRNSDNFTHDLSYTVNGTTYPIGTNITTSQKYTFPVSLISSFTNTATPNITVTCTTKNGSTTLGTTNTIVYLNVPSSYTPTCTLVLSEGGSLVPSAWGIYVKSKSKIAGVITASGSAGSTISNYSSSGNNQIFTTSNFLTTELNSSGNMIFSSTVTDSRGRQASASKTINIIDYWTPSLSNFSIQRCDSNGTLNEEGTYGKAKFTFSIAPVNNNNTKKVIITRDGQTKTFNLSSYAGTYEATSSELFSGLETNETYTFTFKIVDYFNVEGISYTFTVTPSYTLISKRAGGKGITFGQVATEDGFNCYLDADFKAGFKIGGKSLPKTINNLTSSSTTDNLSAYQGKVLNGKITTINEKFDNLNVYSTEEQVIGKWINGKPLYRKTLMITTVLGNGNTVNHGVANIGNHRVVKECEFIYNNMNWSTTYVNSTSYAFIERIGSQDISFSIGSNWNGLFTCNVTIEYTKTTDVATIEVDTISI